MQPPERPALRYHGGKWRLAPWIIGYMPTHRVYVEPFGGAASVLLRKPRSYSEVYNDLDGRVANVFRVLRDPEKRSSLKEQVYWTPFAREEYEHSKESADDPIEDARRMITRAFQGHIGAGAPGSNSGFRSHTKRRGTDHADTWISWPEQVDRFGERLRGVVIERRPAMRVIQDQDSEETLFYCDPPYVQSEREAVEMYDHEMVEDDHRALAEVLRGVEGKVLLSGYDSSLYEDLYGDWQTARRTANANGQSGGRKRTEVLWMNNAASNQNNTLFGSHA